ncbi:MAG: tetratricopeptide repeat protein [bacterium]
MITLSDNIYEKIIGSVLLVMVFGIALAFNLATYDSCYVKITILQLGATLIFGAWLLGLLSSSHFTKQTRNLLLFNIPVFAFFLWGLVTFFISPFKGAGTEELIKLLCYASVYFVVINNVKQALLRRIIYSVLITAFIAVFYAYVQRFGFDPYVWKGAFNERVFSTFGNPNFLGAYLVVSAPLILALFLRTRKYFYLAFFIFLATGIYFTGSKGAWLAFAAETLIFSLLAIFFLIRRGMKHIKTFLVGVSIFIIVGSSIGVAFLTIKRPDSILFRLLTWRSTFEMIELNPITGNGLNSFRIIYPKYRHREIFRIEGKHQTETQHPENEFIELASDGGVIGLGIFLWIIAAFAVCGGRELIRLREKAGVYEKDNQKKARKEKVVAVEEKASFLVGLMTGTAGLLVHNLFGVNMRFVSSGFFFWLFLGLITLLVFGHPQVVQRNTSGRSYPEVLMYLLRGAVIGVMVFFIIVFMRYYRADIHHNRGIGFSKSGRWNKALNEYGKVIEYNPYFTMAHYFMGNVYNDRYKERKDEEDAKLGLRKYADVKKLAPDYVMVHYQEGILYSSMGKFDEALRNFQKAIDLDPVFAPTYFRIGMVYTQMEKWDKALESFQQSIDIYPSFFDAQINIANLKFMLGDVEGSEKAFLVARDINPQSITTYRNMGLLYANLNRFDEARRQWKRALAIDPENKEIKYLLDKLDRKVKE